MSSNRFAGFDVTAKTVAEDGGWVGRPLKPGSVVYAAELIAQLRALQRRSPLLQQQLGRKPAHLVTALARCYQNQTGVSAGYSLTNKRISTANCTPSNQN